MYLFLDTNILLHFQDFENINWSKICGEKNVTICICATVIREVDKYKDTGKGKIRERARKISRKINEIIRGKTTSKYPVLYINDPSKQTMNLATFNPLVNDDWIVHSVNEFNSNGKRKAIISNDLGLYNRALSFDIEVLEVPSNYSLPDIPTDEEIKIKELEKRLSLYENSSSKPILTFKNGQNAIALQKVNPTNFSGKKQEIRYRLEKEYPEKNYFSKENQYNVFLPNLNLLMLTKEDVDDYNSKLPEFYETETDYLYIKEVANFVNKNVIPLEFEIVNTGTAVSGLITIELSFGPNAKIYSNESRTQIEMKRVSKPILRSALARKMEAAYNPYMFKSLNETIHGWDLRDSLDNNIFLYELSKPLIHNVPPTSILENEFYIYLGRKQEIIIDWSIADSSLPEKINGKLYVSVK